MPGATLFVFFLLFLVVVLFLSDRLRLDVVALLVILALMLSGVLSPNEALSGFGDPVVFLVAGLFVIGEGLVRTGVAHGIGNWLVDVAGTNETRLLVLLMLVVAGLSAFMSSTGAVAIFIPVVLNLATKAGISPTRLLIPMAFASLIGGMLTLIGTPPNLIVSNALAQAGMEAFSFFSFTPIGLMVLAVGIAYMVLAGRRLLPDKAGEEPMGAGRLSLRNLAERYNLLDKVFRLRIPIGSSLIDQTVAKATLRTRFGATVLGIGRRQRGKSEVAPALIHSEFMRGDAIYVVATKAEVETLARSEGLELLGIEERHRQTVAQELGVGEVLLTPGSNLIGRTLSETHFRERHGGLTVLGILRKGEPITGNIADTSLAFGDSLLVGGGWREVNRLRGEKENFLVLNLPRELDEVAPARTKAPWALATVLGMLALMTFNLVSSVTAVLLAALAMGLTGCLSMKDAYRSINWESLVLIAGMLPMAVALEKTGGLELIVNALVTGLGALGPLALMAGLFLLTSVFSQFISNTATTVLVAPIALGAAASLSVSPYPLLMTVALAASTAFATPVASPVNTLVLGPGRYRFKDFVKVGVPLQLLAMVITLVAVPLLFPF